MCIHFHRLILDLFKISRADHLSNQSCRPCTTYIEDLLSHSARTGLGQSLQHFLVKSLYLGWILSVPRHCFLFCMQTFFTAFCFLTFWRPSRLIVVTPCASHQKIPWTRPCPFPSIKHMRQKTPQGRVKSWERFLTLLSSHHHVLIFKLWCKNWPRPKVPPKL